MDENNTQAKTTTPAEVAPKQPEARSYTQEQLNAMLVDQQQTARQAILQELGFEVKEGQDEKETLQTIKAALDAGKTQAQLDAEARKTAEREREEAQTKAAQLEMKVTALSAGVKPEYLEDVIVLAQSKMRAGMAADKVMQEIGSKYPVFFGQETSAGTGHSNNPPRKHQAGAEGLGQRLAKTGQTAVKSTYFKN